MEGYLRAGDTFISSDYYPDYPASDGWVLSIVLVNSGAAITVPPLSITPDGDSFAINIPAATTAGYASGLYSAISRVSKAGVVHTVRSAPLTILPNLATAQDVRTHARRMLEAINAVLENRATSDVQEYTIGNRSLKRMSISDLMAYRNKYMSEVALEDQANAMAAGNPYIGKIRVRF